VSHF